jgi:hypothetical protein
MKRNSRLPISTLVSALLLAPAVSLAAELVPPAPRQGYFVSAGPALVLGLARDDSRHQHLTYPGGSFDVRLGQMVTEWLGFGLRLDLGQGRTSQRQAALGGIGVDLQVVPWRDLALHAGAGVGYWQSKSRLDSTEPSRGVGGAYYSFGATYDVFLTRASRSGGVAITPGVFVKVLPGDSYGTVVWWGGLELSWWSGLDKQALELPPDQAFAR